MPSSWRLVGRDEELAFLAQTLKSGDVFGCVLSGQAGVGKTRLARELADHAHHDGREVEWLVATNGTSEISLAALAPVLGAPPPPSSASELLQWAGQQVTRRGDLILCVDDAHLLDPASASLLLQLASRRQAFVVATIRAAMPCPDAVISLWKDGWAKRLEVVPLSRDETAVLAHDFLGAELDDRAASRLYELSAGVPLFLRELLIAGLTAGSIVEEEDGTRTWHDPLIATTRLTELVTARLGQLPPGHREAMDFIALGEPLTVAVAERIADRAVLVDLEELDLLTPDHTADTIDGTMVRIAHPLYSEVLRESLPVTATRALYQRLADAATEVGSIETADHTTWREEDLLRIATWRMQSADLGDPQLLVTAAKLALRTFDADLAERLGRAAMAAGAGLQADLVVADALYYANRRDEAATALDALAHADLDIVSRAHVAMHRAGRLMWWTGDDAGASDVLADMAGKIEDANLRWEVSAERAWPLLISNRLSETIAFANSYITNDAVPPRAKMRALPPAVVAFALTGATSTAIDVAEHLVDVTASASDPLPKTQGNILASTHFALWLDGRLAEAEKLLEAMADSVADDWMNSADGLIGFIRAKTALERGHAPRAVGLTEHAIDKLRDDDSALFLPWAYYGLSRSLAMAGELGPARKALVDGLACRKVEVGLCERDRLLAEATIAEATTPGDGARMLDEISTHFEAWGALTYALGAVVDSVRFAGGDPDHTARADRLAARCQGSLAPALARFVGGLTDREPEGLARAGDELESTRLDLHAAEASLVAASVFDGRGQTGSALTARQKAADRLSRCGAVKTPIVTAYGGDAPLAALTKREQEIARLVATGLTNRQIADRLHVSGRTVDNHVQHIFTKLAIQNRDELSSLA